MVGDLRTVAGALVLGAVLSASACTASTGGNGTAQGTTADRTTPAVTTPATSAAQTTSSVPSSVVSSPSVTVIPAPSTPLRTVTVHGASGATYVVKVWAHVHSTTCQDDAYGQPVITYLTVHPCGGLDRVLATTEVNGRGVGLAQSSLGFLGSGDSVYKVAGDFEALVSRDGTGNITDLLRDGYRLPSGPTAVPSPDAFSALGQDAGVVIVDAWYLDGPTPNNDKPLVTMAEDTFLQF